MMKQRGSSGLKLVIKSHEKLNQSLLISEGREFDSIDRMLLLWFRESQFIPEELYLGIKISNRLARFLMNLMKTTEQLILMG